MKLLIDNNIVIDVFQDREPFSEYSTKILKLIEFGDFEGFITANSITDIFYVLKRSIKDKNKVYNYIKLLLEILTIIDLNSEDIFKALDSESNDFEDQLIAVCAYKESIDFIITRNKKDFKISKVPVIEPRAFITKYVLKE